jgi:hypothetical protein
MSNKKRFVGCANGSCTQRTVLNPPKSFGSSNTQSTYKKMKRVGPDLSRATANAMLGVGMSPYRLIPNDKMKPAATSHFFKPLNQQTKEGRSFAGDGGGINKVNPPPRPDNLPTQSLIDFNPPPIDFDPYSESNNTGPPNMSNDGDFLEVNDDLDGMSGADLSTPPISDADESREEEEQEADTMPTRLDLQPTIDDFSEEIEDKNGEIYRINLLLRKENDPQTISKMTDHISELKNDIKLAYENIAETRRGPGFTTAPQTHIPSATHIPHRRRFQINTGFGSTPLGGSSHSRDVQQTHNGRPLSYSPSSTFGGAGAGGPRVRQVADGIMTGDLLSYQEADENPLPMAVAVDDMPLGIHDMPLGIRSATASKNVTSRKKKKKKTNKRK